MRLAQKPLNETKRPEEGDTVYFKYASHEVKQGTLIGSYAHGPVNMRQYVLVIKLPNGQTMEIERRHIVSVNRPPKNESTMKLTQGQVRALIEQTLVEAKTNPDDAIQQLEAAVKTIIKLAPGVIKHLNKLASQLSGVAHDNEDYDLCDKLEEVSFNLDNLFVGPAVEIDALASFRKLVTAASKKVKSPKASPPEAPTRRPVSSGIDAGMRTIRGGSGVHRTSARVGGRKMR